MNRDQIIEEIQFGASRAELASSMGISVQKLRVILEALDIQWAKIPKFKPTKGRIENGKLQLKRARKLAVESRKVHTAFGVTDTLRGLHKRFGVVAFVTFERRRYRNMPLEEALTKPAIPRGGRNAKAKN